MRGHGYAKRGGTELAEFVVAGRDQDRDPFHIGFLVVHLPRQCGAVGIMTTAEESVGIRGNDLVDDRTEIGGRGRVGFIHHHLQPGCFGLLLGRREHRFRERIVGIDDGDLGVRILRLQRLDRVRQIMARRGDHHEQIFVAKLERLLLGAASIDHDLSVLLGDDRGRRGQAGRIWAEQKLRAVLVDQPRIELLHPAADRLIVVADEVHFIAFAAGFDAAGGVDLVAHIS